MRSKDLSRPGFSMCVGCDEIELEGHGDSLGNIESLLYHAFSPMKIRADGRWDACIEITFLLWDLCRTLPIRRENDTIISVVFSPLKGYPLCKSSVWIGRTSRTVKLSITRIQPLMLGSFGSGRKMARSPLPCGQFGYPAEPMFLTLSLWITWWMTGKSAPVSL